VIDSSIYRAYDIRGRYPKEFNEQTATIIASALHKRFFNNGPILIAHDARKSSSVLYKAVIKGLKGRKLIKAGAATTPMFYFLVNSHKAGGGIMVTASHNPPEWNGLKVVGKKAFPISGFDIKKIVQDEK
jgi:phosphomannomutase